MLYNILIILMLTAISVNAGTYIVQSIELTKEQKLVQNERKEIFRNGLKKLYKYRQ